MPIDTPSPAQQKLVFWLAVLLIGAVSTLSFLSTNRLVALEERAAESQGALLELNKLVSSLKDVETGARGFIITGDERYLEPFREGPVEFRQSVGRLRGLVQEDPDLAQRIERLEQLGRERIQIAAEMVANRPEVLATPATRTFVERGKGAMDRIRAEADAIIEAEQNVFQRRQNAAERQATLTNFALALGVILSLAAIAWLFSIRGREVHRRRQAEEELRMLNGELEDRVQERTGELRRSQELLHTVVESLPDTVFLKDAEDECRYVLINEAGERLLGRPREELLGAVDHELFPREQADQCLHEDQQVARTGRQRITPERRLPTPQGLRYVESRKVLIPGHDGEGRFVLGIVRDVTENRRLEEQIRQMQRMDAVGQLTGGIAHDFNNLLAVILGNIEILRERMSEGSDDAEMADEAMGAASRGAELVRRMLAFARMQHLEPTTLNLNERVSETIPLLRRSLGESIQVQTREAPDLWSARIDPTQVDDALMNLAINARDAMPKGGRLSIETANVHLDDDYAAHHSEVRPGDYVMLAVSDTGTGMDRDVITRAFEPFYTTKETGRGTGLGLSQVYGWVKQSGGHIKIYSELGHGTTIKLYLPRAHAAEDDGEFAVDPAEAAGGTETILVVEDNPNVRKTVLRQLADLGYETLEASGGDAALEIARSGTSFDLMLTDIVMPGGMTGYELADRIKEMRPEQKVLFTSGYTELAVTDADVPDERPLLSKPYRKKDLGKAVRRILDAAS